MGRNEREGLWGIRLISYFCGMDGMSYRRKSWRRNAKGILKNVGREVREKVC